MYHLYDTSDTRFMTEYMLYSTTTGRCYGFDKPERLTYAFQVVTSGNSYDYFRPDEEPCALLFKFDPADCPELHL